MWTLVAMTRHTGARLAEIGFLLLAIGGVWLAAGQVRLFPFARARTALAGVAFTAAGVLLIVATHWGHFG